MRGLRGRLLALLLGCLTFLLLLELGLRLGSSLYWRGEHSEAGHIRHEIPQRALDCADCSILLSVGDSYTYGYGASPGHDYPSLLQARLHADVQGAGWVVVNGGSPASNSSMIREQLDELLATLEPDVVSLMAGGSNTINLHRFHALAWQGGALARLEAIAYRVRVLRLLRFAWATARRGQHPELWTDDYRRIVGPASLERALARWGEAGPALEPALGALRREEYAEAAALLDGAADDPRGAWARAFALHGQGRLDEANAAWREAVDRWPGDPLLWNGAGETAFARQAWSDARQAFERGIEADPDFGGNHCGAGSVDVQHQRYQDGFERSMRGLALDPDDLRCYPALLEVTRRLGRQGAVAQTLRGVDSAQARHHARLLEEEQGESSAWLREDLEAMLDTLEARGIPALLLDYPTDNHANTVVRAVARERAVPLVPVREAFEERLSMGVPVERLFIPDMHCSDQGNALVAEQIHGTLAERGLLGE